MSLEIAPYRIPTQIATAPALAEAVEKLELLRSKKVWWIDSLLRYEVSSLDDLKTILHERHNFPAAKKEFEEYWDTIDLWLAGYLPKPQLPPRLKLPDRDVRSTARRAKGHRLGARFGATFVDENFRVALKSAARIELSPRCKLRDRVGCEHLGLSEVGEAKVFCLAVAHPEQPELIVAEFPTYDMIKAACIELEILDGSRPVWWIDSEDRTPISDFPALERMLADRARSMI